MLRRRGRPGLVGTMARTAVVAGTATAVSGGVQRRRYAKDQAAADQNEDLQMQEMQAQLNQMQQQQAPPPPPPAAAAPAGDDLMAQLEKLGQMHSAGLLDDGEFAAAKSKLLA